MTARSAALRAALLLAPACAAAVAVCVPGTALAPARAQADGDDVGGRVLAELNRERDARGLAPLVRPPALQSAAEQRARDIAAMPESRRMNRSPRIDAFLAANGITRYAYARERLLMLGGYDEPVARILDLWKGYDEGWRAAMDPDVSEAGMGWAHAADGWSIFLAILIEPVDPPDERALEDIERSVHRRANRQRAAHGLSRLEWDDALARVARAHSRDMAVRDFFDHRNPDGLSTGDRTLAAGLRFRIVAENISSGRNQEDPAATAVGGWMDSPGHRVNLLNPQVTMTGVGAATDEDGNVYITQLYFAPAPAAAPAPEPPPPGSGE